MQDDTKNIPLLKEEKAEQEQYDLPQYKPSKKEKEVVDATFKKFRFSADIRDQRFNNFDGLNLVEYISESYRRTTTNVDIRPDSEDWQSVIHDPFTRNKVNAVLGKIISVLPIAEITPRGDEDIRKGIILTNLYEYSEDVDDYEEFLATYLYEAIVKGTAIAYEGHDKKVQKVRDIKGVGDDITITEAEKKTNKLFAQVVRLEDFYPSNVGVRRLKDMPYCFWRTVVPLEQFRQDFAMFSKVEHVFGNQMRQSGVVNYPYYLDYISQDVPLGSVEVIRYYNRDTDEYVIIANGIWLNPIMVKEHTEISPIPFTHKELPFFDVKFELFETDFFYGKSLPDKLKNLQDVLNVLTNMLLDQSFLTIFPPILTNGFDSIEDDYLRPGRRTPVDTQGLPINEAYMKLDMGTPSGWHQYILEYTRKVMEEASLDKVSSGQAGAGDRTTAQEIRVAAEGVSAMLGLFGRWIKYGLKRKALLRCKNILQFWTTKDNPMFEGIEGEGSTEEFKKAFNIVKSDNTVMSDGKRGQKIIAMFADDQDMPTGKELQERAAITEAMNNRKVEYVAINADYIRNIDFDVRLVVNNKTEGGKDVEKALQLEKVRIYLSFFPELVNKEELLAQTAEKMGDDPAKIIKPEVLDAAIAAGKDNKMLDKGVQTEPGQNTANNVVRGAQGGDAMGNAMTGIQQDMMG